MRVALAQIQLNGLSAAANLQHILAAIDRAADAVPGPDIIVLPGGCDTAGRRPDPSSTARDACFREAVACKAREWGIFVAVGLHLRENGESKPAAVLFDPDGDIVACSSDAASGPSQTHESPSPCVWSSPSGSITVLTAAALRQRQTLSVTADLLVSVPVAPCETSELANVTSWLSNVAEARPPKRATYLALVVPAGGTADPKANTQDMHTTRLLDNQGRALTRASSTAEECLHAEIPLRAVAPKEQEASSKSGGGIGDAG